MEEKLINITYSLLGMIATGVFGWIGNWLRKNFKEMRTAKKQFEEIKFNIDTAYKEIKIAQEEVTQHQNAMENKADKKILELEQQLNSEIRKLEDSFRDEKECVSKTNDERFETARKKHDQTIERVNKVVDSFDDKLKDAEDRLKCNTLTRAKFQEVIGKLKEDFFHQLLDIKTKLDSNKKVDVNETNADISSVIAMSKRIIGISKKVLEYDVKFQEYEIKLDECMSLIDNEAKKADLIGKQHAHKVNNVHQAVSSLKSVSQKRHNAIENRFIGIEEGIEVKGEKVREIVKKSLAESSKTKNELKEIINSHRNIIEKKINESDAKIDKVILEINRVKVDAKKKKLSSNKPDGNVIFKK